MPLRFVIFFSVITSIAVLVHVYLWRRLFRDTQLPRRWQRTGAIVIGCLLLTVVGSLALRRLVPLHVLRWVLMPAYVWIGMVLLLVTAFVAWDAVRLVHHAGRTLFRRSAPHDPDRRVALARIVGGGAMLTVTTVAASSPRSAVALSAIVKRHIDVPLPNLPPELDGFRIVQITDLHIGWILRRAWLAGVVDRVNELKPDLVAITGDLVDGSVETLYPEVEPLARLRAKHGVFFCTGNHEYYSGAVEWCEALPRLGVRVLRNERVAIGTKQASFDLVGVDDFHAAGLAPGHGPDLPRALRGRDPSRASVLLAHQPRAVFEAATLGVGLQLSGHTHGGQIWPFSYLVLLQQPYISGLIDHEGTWLYVSEGTGFWGPPMRVGTNAEITEISLRTHRA